MNILLIDADRTIQRARLEKVGQRKRHPDKALMCISTYHKERGDDAGIDTRRDLSVYVYCHDDAHYDDAVERCRQVKGWGTHAYAMINRNTERTPRMSLLAHWTRPQAFFAHDISEYNRRLRA